MAYKIAIATTDDVHVNEHFGAASRIVIYWAEGNVWAVDEVIHFEDGKDHCTGQHNSAEIHLSAVSECEYIIASRIGSRIQRYFEYQKQKFFEMPDAEVSMILTKILKYQERLIQRKEV